MTPAFAIGNPLHPDTLIFMLHLDSLDGNSLFPGTSSHLVVSFARKSKEANGIGWKVQKWMKVGLAGKNAKTEGGCGRLVQWAK